MPIFVVPVHERALREFNDCHVPAGSASGGQFCAKGSQLTIPFDAPTARKSNPYFPTTSPGALQGERAGALKHYGSRVHDAQTLTDWAAEQISASLGVPAKNITVATVEPQHDGFGNSNGGYVHPQHPDVLRLTDFTQQHVEQYLSGQPDRRNLEAVQVILHELMHVHSIKPDAVADEQQLLDTDPAGFFLARGLEEGLASHLSQQLVKRLVGQTTRTSAYYLEQAVVRRMERRAGHNFIRDLYRASFSERAAMVYKRFPKARNLGAVFHYGEQQRRLGHMMPDPQGFKLILDVLNEANRPESVYAIIRAIWTATSRPALERLRQDWVAQRAEFTAGEQFMVGEQWALRSATLS